MRVLNLDILKEGLPGITPTRGAYFMEAAIVGLRKRGFHSGVRLQVYGDFEEEFEVHWSHFMDDASIQSWRDGRNHSNFGAVGLALLLMAELQGFTVFEEALIGQGIDYWLTKTELAKDEISFSKVQARLEISGIAIETKDNTVNMRIQQKKQQIAVSDSSNLPGWIAVVEFSTPKSKIVKK